MKKLIALALLLVAGNAFAAITGSKHDFNTGSTAFKASGTGADEMCAYCHTPHNGTNTDAAPLWNKTLSTNTFTAYGTTVAGTTIANSNPSGVTRVCLGCHDGTIAPGTVVNAPNRGWTNDTDKLTSSSLAFFGNDMGDDHPVGFDYSTAKNVTAEGSLSSVFTLFGADKTMECATCHDVHRENETAPYQPMLVASNAVSAMCQSCHNK